MRRLTARQLRWRVSAQLARWAVARRLLSIGRRWIFGALDVRDRLLRRSRPRTLPPRRLIFVGGLAFESVGQEFLAHLQRLGSLTRDSDVLDVGCGVGRMAVPLAQCLGPSSRYEGFDVVPEGIEWCRAEISSRRPNFGFQLIDVRNPRYNPGGSIAADEVEFPYPDASFDLVFATSVFTHMLPEEVEQYLRESRRVLRPGGRLFTTWYLLDEARPRAKGARGDQTAWFPARVGIARAVSRHVPEAAVAHDEQWARRAHMNAGLEPVTVEHGSWLGVAGPTWQDTVVAIGSQRTGEASAAV